MAKVHCCVVFPFQFTKTVADWVFVDGGGAGIEIANSLLGRLCLF